MLILTSDNELVTCTEETIVEVKNVFYKDQLIGVNVVIHTEDGEVILDTYDSTEEAIEVFNYIRHTDCNYIDISILNKELEII